ncbi:MAG TPA: deoxyuridine 5'-triphosphate nucleotidohydrolase [Desulfurococcales archaeon]|nr:deoxyuridine 5'-triphosphate nucleotidohydrolase [Desulfurococcales archaeon]
MALPGDEVIKFLKDLVDSGVQVQPAGVDLTLRSVFRFTSAGYIGFKDKELPRVEEIRPENGVWTLPPGVYKIMYNEVIEVPRDSIGLAFPRSTLLRLGVDIRCAVWDPGYKGRSVSLLVVHNPYGVKLREGARIAQLVFIKLAKPPSKVYRGDYYLENI